MAGRAIAVRLAAVGGEFAVAGFADGTRHRLGGHRLGIGDELFELCHALFVHRVDYGHWPVFHRVGHERRARVGADADFGVALGEVDARQRAAGIARFFFQPAGASPVTDLSEASNGSKLLTASAGADGKRVHPLRTGAVTAAPSSKKALLWV